MVNNFAVYSVDEVNSEIAASNNDAGLPEGIGTEHEDDSPAVSTESPPILPWSWTESGAAGPAPTAAAGSMPLQLQDAMSAPLFFLRQGKL